MKLKIKPKNCKTCGKPPTAVQGEDFFTGEDKTFEVFCYPCNVQTEKFPDDEQAAEAWNKDHGEG